jgi:mRNA interferase MazF
MMDIMDMPNNSRNLDRKKKRASAEDDNTDAPLAGGQMEINQGDIYWVKVKEPNMAEAGYTHPHVVVQEDVLSRSRINTVVVCALTTNLKRAKSPGNVLLEAGEAHLPRQSVVVVSQVSVVDKTQLGEYIGSLARQRIHQILEGMQFLQRLTEHQEKS